MSLPFSSSDKQEQESSTLSFIVKREITPASEDKIPYSLESVSSYLTKLTTTPLLGPPRGRSLYLLLVGTFTTFIAMAIIAGLQQSVFDERERVILLTGLGGSLAVVCANPENPTAQPRMVIFGQTISAAVGYGVRALLIDAGEQWDWFRGGLGVAGSVVVMQATNCFHPPSAATALNAAISVELENGGLYVAFTMLCAIIVCSVGSIVNMLFRGVKYPHFVL
eukprot:TRINITY_DN9131_c0_g1_i1.p1 TRINITY_DN9131_c0_g1~~TRINITY_DN9131_c0_g1_i1.p1  ORF type:complete len:233 (+),score=29.77 TRINITY_DN9131_c0_g1_i1:32-700(+)